MSIVVIVCFWVLFICNYIDLLNKPIVIKWTKGRKGRYIMTDFETQLNQLLERTKNIKSPINAAPLGTNINE